jgi:cbb3-type cytochrome oxidase subunit 3
MSADKIIAIAIALVIVGGIWWAMRRKRHRSDPSRPMTKNEYDRRHRNQGPTP